MLKHVVVVDALARTYSADLSKAVRSSGFDVAAFVLLDHTLAIASAPGTITSGYQSIVGVIDSPLGVATMSGHINSVTVPAIYSADAAKRDVVRRDMSNVAISTAAINGVSFNLGYRLQLSDRINEYDANASRAYSGLFLSASAVNSPYVSLTNGGNYVGTTWTMNDALDVRAGISWLSPQHPWNGPPASELLARNFARRALSTREQRNADAALMSVSWNFARWGGLGVVASQTIEHNGILGGTGSGAFNIARSAATSAVDASLRVKLGDDWLATLAYGEGLTHLSILPGGLVDSASALRSRSYGIAIATRDVFGDDALGIAVTRPMHVYDGSAAISAATDVDDAGYLTISHSQVGFAPRTPETHLEVGYTRTFMDGMLMLQSDAAYQFGVDGQVGRNAAAFVTRLKLRL